MISRGPYNKSLQTFPSCLPEVSVGLAFQLLEASLPALLRGCRLTGRRPLWRCWWGWRWSQSHTRAWRCSSTGANPLPPGRQPSNRHNLKAEHNVHSLPSLSKWLIIFKKIGMTLTLAILLAVSSGVLALALSMLKTFAHRFLDFFVRDTWARSCYETCTGPAITGVSSVTFEAISKTFLVFSSG